jgi:hypothetical protein
MKQNFLTKLFNWVGGFFSSNPNTPSMKRLCGLLCTIFLCYTLYENSKTDEKIMPSVPLVETVGLLAFGCLGLTTAEVLKGKKAMKTLKGDDDGNTEESSN